MVRPSYRLNETVGPLPIFKAGDNDEDLRGFKGAEIQLGDRLETVH